MLTEWWYYTGHLHTVSGDRYGYELVFFQSRRQGTPPGYAAHFAITDSTRQTFSYSERTSAGEQATGAPGFRLSIGSWLLQGSRGHDRLEADLPGYALSLDLVADKPAVLHQGSGLIALGPAGTTYYYSRTRVLANGTLSNSLTDGIAQPVAGTAWMDHQWGDFIVGSAGGWDWYAIQLDDGSDIMLSFNRGSDNRPTFSYGTYVAPDGTSTTLSSDQMSSSAAGSWTSPRSGATYPSGWRVVLPPLQLALTITPILRDQELVGPAAGGVTYWEGDAGVSGDRNDVPVTGKAYVELTGYAT